MLIRSQDHQRIDDKLINLDNMSCICVEGIIAPFSIRASQWELGRYSSKEKAKKVLDMIQREYLKCIMDYGSSNSDIKVHTPPKCFQMPLDEDVEKLEKINSYTQLSDKGLIGLLRCRRHRNE